MLMRSPHADELQYSKIADADIMMSQRSTQQMMGDGSWILLHFGINTFLAVKLIIISLSSPALNSPSPKK
jgi:hypothetical protein